MTGRPARLRARAFRKDDDHRAMGRPIPCRGNGQAPVYLPNRNGVVRACRWVWLRSF